MSIPLPQPAADSRQPTAGNLRSGLTVLELVSALALFVIVLGTLMVALNSATDIWSRTTAKNRSQNSARQALDQLATDLASAVAQASSKPDSPTPPGSGGTLSDDEPFFIAENKSDQQIGLYFVRQRSPAEMSGESSRSLELVAYSWTTNGLSRYAVPVVSSDEGLITPPVSEQLAEFAQDVSEISALSNLLSSAVVQFVPFIYKPTSPAITVSETQPIDPLNKSGEKVEMADLPDYVDVHVACVDRQGSATAFSITNYMTRRITLPAAQASRLP